MELHQALRNIIEKEGTEIIKDIKVINFLDDYNAFDNLPALKYILKSIIVEGYSIKLLTIGKWDNQAISLVNKFAATTGFIPEFIDILFQSLAYGLGWIKEIKLNKNIISNLPNLNINQHLEFKGIPIYGSEEEFRELLIKKGFNDYGYSLEGPFAGFYDCKVDIFTSPYSQEVIGLLIRIPINSKNDWISHLSVYNRINELLTNKYSNPSIEEIYENPFFKGDGRELTGLKKNKIKFNTRYETQWGDIELSLSHGYLTLTYFDKLGYLLDEELIKQEV